MSAPTEPLHEEASHGTSEDKQKEGKFCAPDFFEKNIYNPNGAGPGSCTCLCGITCGNWCIILLLFAVYYTFLGMFFWGLIEALFSVKAQGTPSQLHATDRY